MSVKIHTVTKVLPKYTKKTEDILPFIDLWMEGQDNRLKRKTIKIFENAQVDQRYSLFEPLEVFTQTSFQKRNEIYSREVIAIGTELVQKALQKAHWNADSIDYIITVSCTGIMIPSLDAYLINALKMRQDVVRLPVTEMGCAAGVSGLIYATQFLKANPGKRAAVIAVESPAATFLLNDFSMANIVSAAIFGDGAACTLLTSEADASGPEIMDTKMYHFFNAEHLMGFELTNNGLKMVLDEGVPETISTHFSNILNPFLEQNKLTVKDINHFIFHPGGKKILELVESLFDEMGKNIDDTREVLRLYGNMSSATILYVLERFMDRNIPKNEQGLMLSFGPGFSAQQVLLKW
ncbi:3-oxoacyl-[acyl-carrier-protein] synthase III C-terminal domain-containing protein [uncultured Planktosalinus sp.]|uniref:type III polyketide synthase n=1 Tax=uncultured Planktosalinus sp. TaxID=1810935 RepID=UPI0030DAA74D